MIDPPNYSRAICSALLMNSALIVINPPREDRESPYDTSTDRESPHDTSQTGRVRMTRHRPGESHDMTTDRKSPHDTSQTESV